jgi:hypothetical protein
MFEPQTSRYARLRLTLCKSHYIVLPVVIEVHADRFIALSLCGEFEYLDDVSRRNLE